LILVTARCIGHGVCNFHVLGFSILARMIAGMVYVHSTLEISQREKFFFFREQL
jgi:hypothetical protein